MYYNCLSSLIFFLLAVAFSSGVNPLGEAPIPISPRQLSAAAGDIVIHIYYCRISDHFMRSLPFVKRSNDDR